MEQPATQEHRIELTQKDLVIVRWLIELSWSTGAVKGTEQARDLVSLNARIEATLEAAGKAAGPRPAAAAQSEGGKA